MGSGNNIGKNVFLKVKDFGAITSEVVAKLCQQGKNVTAQIDIDEDEAEEIKKGNVDAFELTKRGKLKKIILS